MRNVISPDLVNSINVTEGRFCESCFCKRVRDEVLFPEQNDHDYTEGGGVNSFTVKLKM